MNFKQYIKQKRKYGDIFEQEVAEMIITQTENYNSEIEAAKEIVYNGVESGYGKIHNKDIAELFSKDVELLIEYIDEIFKSDFVEEGFFKKKTLNLLRTYSLVCDYILEKYLGENNINL